MSTNKGGRAMAAAAASGPRDAQGDSPSGTLRDRHARARVKMRRKLRRRGHREPLAHLAAVELVQLMKESKPKGAA